MPSGMFSVIAVGAIAPTAIGGPPGAAIAAVGAVGGARVGMNAFDVPETTRQVIEVSARSWRTSHAHLRAWRRTAAGEWEQVFDARARLGANGLVRGRARKQNTATTPAGTFALGQAFGLRRAPAGTRMPYRRVTDADYWVYDPADPGTYNRWIVGHRKADRWRTSQAEHLIDYSPEYRYAVVIDYNHAASGGQPDTAAGGGIFLHVNGEGPTSGCVSIPRSKMAKALGWLHPRADPRIIIGARR